MAATSDIIYVTMVAMEMSWTPHGYTLLKVQKKLIICAKYQVNQMNGVESRGKGSDYPPPPPPVIASCVTFYGLCLF